MTLREYLAQNPYFDQPDATFPTLTLVAEPSATDADCVNKCLVALVTQNNQILSFLNTFQGQNLGALFGNIGGTRRAANAATLLMARKLEDAAETSGLDLIHIPGTTGGAYVNVFQPPELAESEDEIETIWSIQNDWIDAEITRLSSLLSLLEKAETLVPPNLDDTSARGLWSWITGLPALAARLEPHIAMAIRIIEVADAAINVGTFAYSIYKRFWVEKETLRNLPQALIALCRMTIELLRKIRQIPASPANFEMRQQMVTDLTERLEQQMQFFITGQNQYLLPSTMAAGMEQLTQALQDLMYKDDSIDFGGVHVAMRSKLITEP